MSPAVRRGPWWAVGLAALQVLGLGSLYAWSVLIGPVQARFGVGRTETGLVFALAMAVFTVAVLLGPRCIAGRRPPYVGAFACVAGAAGLGSAALAPTFPLFLMAYAGLFAAASGLGYAAGLQIAAGSGLARTGLATGVVVASYALGAVTLGPAMSVLGDAFGLTVALAVPACMLVVIAGGSAVLGALTPATTTPKGSTPRELDVAGALGRELPSPPAGLIALLWFAFGCGAAGGLMAIGHAAGIVAAAGGTAAVGGLAAAVIATGNASGRLACGPIADRFGPRRVLVAAAFGAAVAIGVMSLVSDVAVLLVSLGVIGVSYGMMATGYPVAVQRFFGAARFGVVYGRVFTAWGLAGLTAPWLAGWIFDRNDDYRPALVIASAAACLSALAASRIPR